MSNTANIPNFANVTQAKLLRGDSFTVPDSVQQASPSGISSGLSPATIFDSKRLGVGGYIFLALSDAAGPAVDDFQYKINPGDVVALTNASPALVQVNSVTVYSITNTSFAAIQLYYS